MRVMPRPSQKKPKYPLSFLRHWRELRGLSQEDLAQAAECGQQQISKLERGEHSMDISWAQRFAKALGTTPAEIMFGPDDPVIAAMREKVSGMTDADKSRLLKIAETFLPQAEPDPGMPDALRRAIEETGEQLTGFDRPLWHQLDEFTRSEYRKIPEIGETTEIQRADTVATLYLLAHRDLEAGLKPDYSRFAIFVRGQAKSMRARRQRRAQA